MMANNTLSVPNNTGDTSSLSALENDQSLKLFVPNLVNGTSERDVVQKIKDEMPDIQIKPAETAVDPETGLVTGTVLTSSAVLLMLTQ